jgi:hypothetical protein
MPTSDSPWRPIPASAIDALHHGRIELAIRVVREAEQVDFREAKRLVERHICSHPQLFEAWSHRRNQARRVLRWSVRSIAVAGAVAVACCS